MNGAAVDWGLGAAFATVAWVAGRRLVSSRARRPAFGRVRSALHLAMALGMAVTLAPTHGPVVGVALRIGFGVLSVGLGLDRIRLLLNASWAGRPGTGRPAAGAHRLHHAAMAGIMALMAAPTGTGAATAMSGVAASVSGSGMAASGMTTSGMVMPQGVGGPSLILLTAFGYACVFALVFAWRLPGLADARAERGEADPLGQACEVTMLVGTAVMLLPLL